MPRTDRAGIYCVHCDSTRTLQTIDTRKTPLGVRRRRRCPDCAARTTTIEVVIPKNIKPWEASGVREQIERFVTAMRSKLPGTEI